MSAFITAGAGFLLAVLWFDLMFDVQVRGSRGTVPEDALASIAAYYARVTTAARAMSRLIDLLRQLAEGPEVPGGVASAAAAAARVLDRGIVLESALI